VFENRVLRKIFGPKKDDETGEWRKLHSDEVRDLHSSTKHLSSDQIRKNEVDGTCCTYEAEDRCIQSFGEEASMRGRDHLEDLGIDGRIILRLIINQYAEGTYTGLMVIRDRWRGLLESGYIKCGEFPGLAEELSISQEVLF